MSNPAIETALSLKGQRRYTEAAQALRSYLAQNPADGEAQGLLMQIQEMMMLELQIQQKLKRARGQLLEGDNDGARAIAEEILKLDAAHPEAIEILSSAGGGAPQTIDMQATMMDTTPLISANDFMMADTPDAASGGSVIVGDVPLSGPDDMPGGVVFEAPAPAPAANLSTAESGKVRDFITRGKAAIAAGNHQDAIDILTRVFIIDENNTEAQQLIDQARSQMDSAGASLDQEINEAVGLFNAGDFNRAKGAFGEILKKSPNHAEALGYLSQIAQREHAQSAPAVMDNFEVDSGASAIPAAQAEPEAAPEPQYTPPPRPMSRPRGDDFGGSPSGAPSRAAASAGLPKWALGVAGALALAAVFILYLVFKPKPPAPPPPVSVASTPKPPPQSAVVASVASAPVAPPAPLDPHQLEIKALAEGTDAEAMLAVTKREFEARHYDDLKVLIAAILALQPNRGDMLKLKDDALRQEADELEYTENLKRARNLMDQTEYEDALRISWKLRFPEDRMKVADRLGLHEHLMAVWSASDYNTALKAMRNQNVESAESYLTDYLDVNPKDTDAKKVLETIKEYKIKTPDKTYFDYVTALKLKPTPPAPAPPAPIVIPTAAPAASAAAAPASAPK